MLNIYTIAQSDTLYVNSLNQHTMVLHMQINKNELNFILYNITKSLLYNG